MIVNGMLIPPANAGGGLEPGGPGYRDAPPAACIEYLTPEQKGTLREAARVESCARQQLALLDAAHRMGAAGCRLGRDFVGLSATGCIYRVELENSMGGMESAAASPLAAMQELRFQLGGLPGRDVAGGVLHSSNFHIGNKRRALEWHWKELQAHNNDKGEM